MKIAKTAKIWYLHFCCCNWGATRFFEVVGFGTGQVLFKARLGEQRRNLQGYCNSRPRLTCGKMEAGDGVARKAPRKNSVFDVEVLKTELERIGVKALHVYTIWT